MSTSSDLQDILRRHTVGSKAELTVEATTAAMAIRAAIHSQYHPRQAHLQAVQSMLDRIDQVATYKHDGLLSQFVSSEHVAKASVELLQVMARAAHGTDTPQGADQIIEDTFPVLESLVECRKAVEVDGVDISIVDPSEATRLADALETLAQEVLNEAIAEDRKRTSSYAVH